MGLEEPWPLPARFDQKCGFWARLLGSCILSPVRYSPALSAVISSGWDVQREYGGILYRGGLAGMPLVSPKGEPIGYLWDYDEGYAILRSESGKGYNANLGGMSRCGQYPPLLR